MVKLSLKNKSLYINILNGSLGTCLCANFTHQINGFVAGFTEVLVLVVTFAAWPWGSDPANLRKPDAKPPNNVLYLDNLA